MNISRYYDSYFWLKQVGTFTVTTCREYNSWASQKGSFTLESFSTWKNTDKKISENILSQSSSKSTVLTYTICFSTGINSHPICCLLEHNRDTLSANRLRHLENHQNPTFWEMKLQPAGKEYKMWTSSSATISSRS